MEKSIGGEQVAWDAITERHFSGAEGLGKTWIMEQGATGAELVPFLLPSHVNTY